MRSRRLDWLLHKMQEYILPSYVADSHRKLYGTGGNKRSLNATVVALTAADTISDEDVTPLHEQGCPDFHYQVEREDHSSYAVRGRAFHMAFSFILILFQLI